MTASSSSDPLIFAALAMFVLIASWAQWGFSWGTRFGSWCMHRGWRNACRAAISTLRVHPHPYAGFAAEQMRIRLHADEARTTIALSELENLVSATTRMQSVMQPFNSAAMIDVWVNAGKYDAAIRAPRRFRWGTQRRHAPSLFQIANINRAEALHNVGRDDLALRVLARTPRTTPVALHGGAVLEAWIHADRGRTQAAKNSFETIDPRPLAPYYSAEILYTRALIELSAGEYELAFASATEGLARSVRASSERNGLFLLGRVEALRGNLESAIAYYGRARAHRYRGQSARGLFELGQLYEVQNLPSAARAAYAQAIEEDAESAAAHRCRERLAQLGSATAGGESPPR